MKNKKILFMIFTLICFTAIGVCFIVNIAINQKITWAMYPFISIPYAWLLSLSILTFPLLFLMSKITPVTDWFLPIGLPSTIIGIISIWIIYYLFQFTKINIWYKSAISIFLLGVIVNTLISYFVDRYLKVDPFTWDKYINILACIVASATLGIIGYKKIRIKI